MKTIGAALPRLAMLPMVSITFSTTSVARTTSFVTSTSKKPEAFAREPEPNATAAAATIFAVPNSFFTSVRISPKGLNTLSLRNCNHLDASFASAGRFSRVIRTSVRNATVPLYCHEFWASVLLRSRSASSRSSTPMVALCERSRATCVLAVNTKSGPSVPTTPCANVTTRLPFSSLRPTPMGTVPL